jgi:Transposase DDE domain group 1
VKLRVPEPHVNWRFDRRGELCISPGHAKGAEKRTNHGAVTHRLPVVCQQHARLGAENAMILVRLLAALRRHWPRTHILVRGDSHFATPEVIEVLAHRHLIDFVFGLAGNPVLLRHAAPVMQEARCLHQQRTVLAHAHHARPPASSRLYAEFAYAAASWAQPWRVILKAEVMAAGDNPRFVVTSLEAPTYAARTRMRGKRARPCWPLRRRSNAWL